MPVYKTAAFRVRPEGLDASLEAIRQFVGYIKANEPETLQYTSVQNAEDPLDFLHFFIFEDKAAEERHASSEGVNKFTSILYPLLDGEVSFIEYELVASVHRPN